MLPLGRLWRGCRARLLLPPGIRHHAACAAQATLGDDIYGVLCDRVGAGRAHRGPRPAPRTTPSATTTPRASTATRSTRPAPAVDGDDRGQARAPRRSPRSRPWRGAAGELIRAFNAIFPDIEIHDLDHARTGRPGPPPRRAVELRPDDRAALRDEPVRRRGRAAVPASTRSLGRLFDALAGSERRARTRWLGIWGRQGYRPSQVGPRRDPRRARLPELRELTKASLGVLGPDGAAAPRAPAAPRRGQAELLDRRGRSSRRSPPYVVERRRRSRTGRATNIEFAAALCSPRTRLRGRRRRAARATSRSATAAASWCPRATRRASRPVAAPFADLGRRRLRRRRRLRPLRRRRGDAARRSTRRSPSPAVTGAARRVRPARRTALYTYLDTSRTARRRLARTWSRSSTPTQYGAAGRPGRLEARARDAHVRARPARTCSTAAARTAAVRLRHGAIQSPGAKLRRQRLGRRRLRRRTCASAARTRRSRSSSTPPARCSPTRTPTCSCSAHRSDREPRAAGGARSSARRCACKEIADEHDALGARKARSRTRRCRTDAHLGRDGAVLARSRSARA